MESSVLIIDDSKSVRQQIIHILKRSSLFRFYFEAGDGVEALKMVLNRPVDLILCDLEMPGMDGFKFLKMMSAREDLKDIPVIMITGREDQEAKVRGLEQGASDYVTKPFDAAELLARVKVQIKIKSLQDSLKKSNQLLLELSNTDPLTRLSNRRCLMEILLREFNRVKRTKGVLSLIMIDIDHFKKINDTFGHQKGDAVLVALADLQRNHLREYDTAARFGGEEFALVLPDTSIEQATQVAERLRAAAATLSFPAIAPTLKLTISLGVASFPGGKIATVDELIREADYALYDAKRAGRNQTIAMAS